MSTNINELSPQEAALRKAYELLGEHFDALLIVVSADVEDVEPCSMRDLRYKGYIEAVGMATWAQHKLLQEPDI